MKKNSLYFVIMLFSIIGFTSCLEGSNVRSEGGFGVVDFGSKSLSVAVFKTTGGEVYAPELSSMVSKGDLNIGDLLYVGYTIDFDLAENSDNAVTASGYYTASIDRYVKFDKNYLSYSFTDTAGIQMNEIAVNDPFSQNYGGINGLYGRYIYLTHAVSQPEGSTLSWDLSYDSETMMPTDVSGKRYYDLFLRATITGESSKAAVNYLHCVAYDMRSYLSAAASLEKEKLGGSYNSSSTFTIRVNYASAINGNAITWSNKEMNLYIISYLPSSN